MDKHLTRLLTLASILATMSIVVIACASISPTTEAGRLPRPTDVSRKIVTSSLPLINAWQFAAPLLISWVPIVERGVVLVRSQYGLQAINGATGQKKWEYPFGRSGGVDFPIVTDGDTVAVAGARRLRVLDFESGREIWQQETIGSDWIAALAMDDERVYAAATIATSQVAAYDLHSGTLLWRQDKLVPRSMFGVYLSGDNLHVFSGGRFILDKRTGAIIGQPEKLAFNSRLFPVVASQTIFIATLDGTLKAIDLLSLKPRWALDSECSTFRNDFQFPTIVDNTVYAASGCSEVYAVDIFTGRKIWTYRPNTNLRVQSSVAVSDEIAYVVYSDSSLRAIDVHSGEPIGYLQTEPPFTPGVVHGSGIAAGDDYIYAYFGGSDLFAFKVAK